MRDIWIASESKPVEVVAKQTLEPWSLASLKRKFRLLLENVSRTRNLCIFIDGLDEYDGDQSEIIELINSISRFPGIKICLSSRPVIAYENAFSKCPGFRLQDLIQKDIERYIKSSFDGYPKMLQLAQDEPQRRREFADEIVRNASGVFLWVKLVVRSLLEGLQNWDRMGDLYRRLRELPATLDGLYEHMLKMIQPVFYLEQAAEFFQIVQLAHANYTDRQDSYDAPSLTLIALALADHERQETAYKAKIKLMSDDEALSTCQQMDMRLRSRCVGLIESVNFKWTRPDFELGVPGLTVYASKMSRQLPRSPQARKLIARKTSLRPGANSQVTQMSRRALTTKEVYYLHRTVKDFLDQSHIQDTLAKAISTGFNPLFDPALSMLKSCVLQLKWLFSLEGRYLLFPRSHYAHHFWSLVEDALSYAGKLRFPADKAHDVLDELNWTVSQHWAAARHDSKEGYFGYWPMEFFFSTGDMSVIRHSCSHDPFLVLAAQRGLVYYVYEKANKTTDICKHCSLWVAALTYCQVSLPTADHGTEKPDVNSMETWLKTMELLVHQGADVNVEAGKSKGTLYSALTIVDEKFAKWIPVAATRLRGILTEKMQSQGGTIMDPSLLRRPNGAKE